MAEAWPLLVQFDVAEPRPQKGRLMVAGDGTTWDLANSSNVWQDPATLTVMLAPLPVTAAWRTSYSGDYVRYRKTDYTLTTSGSWKELQIKASGDYYLQSLNVTETVTTASTMGNTNQAMYLNLYIPGLKDMDDSIFLKCGWGTGSGSVALWFAANGLVQVYKSGTLVGTYGRNDTNLQPGVGAAWVQSPNQQFVSIMLLPMRRRELVVTTNYGVAFSHVFSDLSAASTTNTIVPNATFNWTVPSGQASVQLAKVKFAASGYILSPVKKLRYAPPTGATFTATSAYDTVGSGTPTVTNSVVKDDGTAYTPNGTIADVRLKVALGAGSSNLSTAGIYAIDMVYDPATSTTYPGDVDVTCHIQSLSLSCGEDGRTTCEITARAAALSTAGVSQSDITSDRPVRIALSDGAVSPAYIDLFRGTLTPPKVEYEQGDTTKGQRVLKFSGQDRSRDFDLSYIVESFPYDGLAGDVAIADLTLQAGYSFSSYGIIDTVTLTLPYTTNISKGQYALAPDYGDTVGGYLDKIKNEYFATWITGWVPTTSGYKYQFRNPSALSTSPQITLYQSIADATTAGVTELLRPKRVVRRLSEYRETPESTSVNVVGQDPNTGTILRSGAIDTAAETAGTAPASRPANWRGRPILYELRDPMLTTQGAVDDAATILYSRLTTGRQLVEWESDLLVIASNNRPVWIGDVVRIIDTDGTSTKGDYRIIAIPTVEFIDERSDGFRVRRAVYRGVKI